MCFCETLLNQSLCERSVILSELLRHKGGPFDIRCQVDVLIGPKF